MGSFHRQCSGHFLDTRNTTSCAQITAQKDPAVDRMKDVGLKDHR